ncbi:PREDICTED: uncharacterized protein LOC106808369 [Priapulus caudatus]|uniref:Uncharacterized protein LOC106808369 n=1 Tax=Priapulus caudatus TaxID=37621 RepID=A0ABM1E2Y3_PRICU|nr:PREDICTED: uncharacterized protein LOC106808369 [Priapulus caudatus]
MAFLWEWTVRQLPAVIILTRGTVTRTRILTTGTTTSLLRTKLAASSDLTILQIGIVLRNNAYGRKLASVMTLAVDAISDRSRRRSSPYGIEQTTRYFSSPSELTASMAELYAEGIKVFIGFEQSESLARAVEWANVNAPDAVLVSPSATAAAEDFPRGNYVMLGMDTGALVLAMLLKFKELGVDVVVPVASDGVYGRSIINQLQKMTANGLYGITVTAPVLYDGRSSATSVVADIRRELTTINPAGGNNTGIILASKMEAGDIINAAFNDEALSEAIWFGTDSIAFSERIFTANNNLVTSGNRLYSFIYCGNHFANNKAAFLTMRMIRKQTGSTPSYTDALAYDAVILVYEAAGDLLRARSGVEKRAELREQSLVTAGITGSLELDHTFRRNDGEICVAFIPSRKLARELVSSGRSSWVLDGKVEIMSDSIGENTGIRSGYTTQSGSVVHPLNKHDLWPLIKKWGPCLNDTIVIHTIDPITLDDITGVYSMKTLPPDIYIPATYGMTVDMQCTRPSGQAIEAVVTCPGLNDPAAKTVCRMDSSSPRRKRRGNWVATGATCAGAGVGCFGGPIACGAGGIACLGNIIGSVTCFAADSIVLTETADGKTLPKKLSELVVGDRVESVEEDSGALTFSDVYFIAHDDEPDKAGEMLRISFNCSDCVGFIELSAAHLLYKSAATDPKPSDPSPASTVKIGDYLWTRTKDGLVASAVTDIQPSAARVRSPLTLNHHIVVNGVHASVHSHDENAYRILTSWIRAVYYVNSDWSNSAMVKSIVDKSRDMRRLIGA